MNRYPIVILGAGESGTGAATLAKAKDYEVFVSDMGVIKPAYKSILQQNNIPYEEKQHTSEIILRADEIIKSPGISDNLLIIKEAKQSGIPVISEIEFASRFSKGKFLCISGSNGKTTTAALTHHILKKGGIDAGLAGNIGNSFAMELAKGDHAWWVLEISSFQLDNMYEFKANIAILTNITPDHLDRYESFEAYVTSKMRIIQNQGINDVFIWFADNMVVRSEVGKRNLLQRSIPYGEKSLGYNEEAWIENNEIKIKINQYIMSITIENLALQGRHNTYNSMAAAVAAKLLDIRNHKIKESLSDFKNVEHRLEFVASVHGIDFINDSKATNVNSTWYALESMKKPVIWIAGGKDKGNDYSILTDLVKQKVKAIVCLGLDNSKIHSAFADYVDTIVDTHSAEQAVEIAYHLGQKGDVIILSPACASFDLFENYEERGEKFKQAVKRL